MGSEMCIRDSLQGSVVRSSVQDHGRRAGGALTGDRRHASAGSSQDSATGHHAIGPTGTFSNRNRQNTEFDDDETATAIVRGLSYFRQETPQASWWSGERYPLISRFSCYA